MNIKEFLIEFRWSGVAIAKKLKIHPGYFNRITNGRTIPSLSLAQDIEKITEGKVTVAELIPALKEPLKTKCECCGQKIRKYQNLRRYTVPV